FTDEQIQELTDSERNGKANRTTARIETLNIDSRYLRIQAINRKTCPDWHDSAGGKAWIFADEIVVE
ncbi:MAG: hypothetical protein HOA19_01345, partial [Candidatus Marinimicrobia bacterium]|nr:hypothetical protein [Candidatus Neomarinimicrobiota bacterium]